MLLNKSLLLSLALSNKVARIGSKQQDLLTLLQISQHTSDSVVVIKQSRAELNCGLSSCRVKDNVLSSFKNIRSSVRF